MRDVAEVALFTDDVAAARAFYRDLVGAEPVAEWPGGAIFAVGATEILVHERAAAMTDGPPNEDHVALAVDQLDETCAALRASGITFLVEPREYPWGRSAYLRDPDGRLVELAEA
jgi:catechol 2,3-dioxygenase-like lactoylglutathione lyase family enzyme